MHFTRTLIAAALIATASAAFAQASINQSRALAGNITPGDTPGFPVIITQPGSYKLTSNLVVPIGLAAIQVAASDVTLDLNGFTISGPGTCSQNPATYAVTCAYNGQAGHGATLAAGSVLKNGTIRGFGVGVVALASGISIERLRLTQNAFYGLYTAKETTGMRIADSTFDLNGGVGAEFWNGMVTGSRFMSNGSHGFNATDDTFVLDSSAFRNFGTGFRGGNLSRTMTRYNKQNRAYVRSVGVQTNLDDKVLY